MYQGIYIDFYSYRFEGKMNFKMFGPKESKKELREEMNRYLLIDLDRLGHLSDLLVDMDHDGTFTKACQDLGIPELKDIEIEIDGCVEQLIKSKNLFKYIGDKEHELFKIVPVD
tara:strand:- start:61 stop:402 length:342 start_codon:yes stop_codon:yes gene_type:complete